MAQRNFSTDFTGGTISATLTLEGYKANELDSMLDNVNKVISKQVHTALIPKLRALVDDPQAVLPGTEEVTETVSIELLDHTATLEIKLNLERELEAPHKDTLNALIANTVATEVIQDLIGRLSGRLYNEATEEYYEQHPEAAPAMSLGEILSRGGGSIEIIGIGGPGSPFSGFGERAH